jgi:2-methylisocitrate lyase-like PEP mutase family enzyme
MRVANYHRIPNLEGLRPVIEWRGRCAVVNQIEHFVGEVGSSPYVELDSLREWGFDLVIFPIAATLSTIANVYADMAAFAEDPVAAMRSIDDQFAAQPVGSLHEFSGFPKVVEWERQYLPDEEQEKYEGSLGDEVDGE